MKRFSLKLVVSVIVITNLLFTSLSFGFISWDNPSGSATNFNWANGGSDVNLFGSPTLVGGNTLVFSPSNFRAESSDGDSCSISDILSFELIAHPGLSFQGISITEYCDYQIIGNGLVNISGSLSVENPASNNILSDSLVSNPGMPLVGSGYVDDSSVTTAQVNINQPDWTSINVTLQNDLLAITYANGSVAWIQKKALGTSIAIQIIPEPATIALLGIGSLTFIRRKK